MKEGSIITLLSFVFIFLAVFSNAFAVPSLQLYMPDGAYYNVSPWFPESGETWITTSNPFELQLAGATTPSWTTFIDNLELHVALLENEYSTDLTETILTIKDSDPNINFEKSLYASDFSFGKPEGISPHGIYNTYFASVSLPNLLVGGAGETVYDYNQNFDPAHLELSASDSGDIQYYLVSYDPRFTFIHFDATGVAHDNGNKTKSVLAPYSHDADVAPTPEPATIGLLGLGLLGLTRKFRRKF